MKAIRKFLIIWLSVFCIILTTFGLISCTAKTSDANIEILENKNIYRVYDSIYVYDLFKWKENQNLTFTYKIDDGESLSVRGEFIYLKVAGVYSVTAKINDKNVAVNEVEVVNPLSVMSLAKNEIEVDFEKSYRIPVLINRAGLVVSSDFEHEEFIDRVTIYPDGEEGESITYDLVKEQEGADGLFDGERFFFKYECDYLFRVYSETSGGRVYYNLTVHCVEDLSKLEDKSEQYDFKVDIQTYKASWKAVENAVSYRVKYAGKTIVIEKTNIDLSELLVDDFYHFDFAVIPVDASGEKLCKFIKKDVIKAPNQAKDLILGRGVIDIDVENSEVTLTGYESVGAGYRTEIHATLNNSYVAFCNKEDGKYGVGTAVEFIFKGNNMPQLCFFADKLNGDITAFGGSGWLLLNGLYTTERQKNSGSTTNVVGENVLGLFGPNRIDAGHENYVGASEWNSANRVSKNTLFTQKYLRENPNVEYKYTVRTFAQEGYLAYQCILEETASETIVATAIKVTEVEASKVEPGYIIAYSTIKGQGDNTTFKYTMPYRYEDNSDANAKTSGVIYKGEKSVYMFPGTHINGSAEQGSIWDCGWISGVGRYRNSYVGFDNKYSVGKAIDIFFTGNNMPIIGLFVNTINDNMSATSVQDKDTLDQTGYIIANGIYDSYNKKTWGENEFIVYGENRISKNVDKYSSNVSTIGGNVFNGLSDKVNYKYTIASVIENGKVVIIIELYDAGKNELINMSKYSTEKTKQEVESLGKGLNIFAGLKGGAKATILSYSEIYDYVYDGGQFQMEGAKINSDGSITLVAGRHISPNVKVDGVMFNEGAWKTGISRYRNSYIAFNNVCEVGSYIDFFFTGNNAPQVTLFANQINQSMGGNSTGESDVLDNNGYILLTGVYDDTNGNVTNFLENSFRVFGPNRVSTSLTTSMSSNLALISGWFSGFKDGVDYKYTVGSRIVDGSVVIQVLLYNQVDNELIYSAIYDTQKSEAEVEALGSHIIAYAGVKGEGLETSFKYSKIHEKPAGELGKPIQMSGAKINNDGSVTLAPGKHSSPNQSDNGTMYNYSAYKSGFANYVNNYIAFEDALKVGNYIDFYFKGNNIPLVTLFANQISASMSSVSSSSKTEIDQNGYIIITDICDNTDFIVKQKEIQTYCKDFLYVYGPNRISDSKVENLTATNLTAVSGEYLGLDDNVNYKYTVGSKVVSGNVVIEISLYDVDKNELIYSATYNTAKAQEEVETLGSNLIVYAGIKGKDLDTTFKYSQIYLNPQQN